MTVLNLITHHLLSIASPSRSVTSARYFKTGKGEYGEGDVFIGVTMPQIRRAAREYCDQVSLKDLGVLIKSTVHEHRMLALLIVVLRYSKTTTETERFKLYQWYIRHKKWVNNWDLVDCSAPHIVGAYLYDKPKNVLATLARSSSMWDRRIAVLSTFFFIAKKQSKDALAIAVILVHDRNDLIQKAVGWMLREIGKRVSKEDEVQFLRMYAPTMPRTMLRYAIERFTPSERQYYLAMKNV